MKSCTDDDRKSGNVIIYGEYYPFVMLILYVLNDTKCNPENLKIHHVVRILLLLLLLLLLNYYYTSVYKFLL